MQIHTIRDRLKALRTEANLSQIELSNLIGLSQNMISNHENGHTPTIEALYAYSRHYKVSIDYIIGTTRARRPSYEDMPQWLTTLDGCVAQGDLSLVAKQSCQDIRKLADVNPASAAKAAKLLREQLLTLGRVADAAAKSDTAALLEHTGKLSMVAIEGGRAILNAHLTPSSPTGDTWLDDAPGS